MNVNYYLDTDYFKDRKFKIGFRRLSGRFKAVWKNGDGCCYHCGMSLDIQDDREIFFKIPKNQGGTDTVSNMAYVHSYCNKLHFESRSKEL